MKKLAFLCACTVFFACTMSALSSSAAVAEDLTLGGLVSEKTIEEMGHVQISDNLTDELNGVEYINEDGTRTAYLFAEPIKYKDENNEIKRIDNSLRREILKKGWSNSANSFSLFVHEEISNGVELTYNDVALKATPVLSQVAASGKQSNASRISAHKVGQVDENIEIAYESTYTGYTTTVTVPGGSGASFALDITGDVSAVADENGRVTVSMKDGSAVVYALQAAFAGDEYLWFDDVEENVTQPKKESARIEYTVSESIAKIADEITLIVGSEVKNTTNNNSRFEDPATISADAMVYSGNANSNYGSNMYSRVGTTLANERYRLFTRIDIDSINYIQYYRVLSARYYLNQVNYVGTSMQVEVYMVTGDWSEAEITWATAPEYNQEKITTVTTSYNNESLQHEFYITQAMMGWLQGIPNYGIMLKSRIEDELGCLVFGSCEHASSIPSFNVTYSMDFTTMDNVGIMDGEEYYIKNKNSMKYLTASGNTSTSNVIQSDWTGNDNQKWTVTYEGEGYYKLNPANATNMVLDTSGGNNTNGANIQLYSSNIGLGQRFKFIRNWDGSYQIVTRLSNDVRGLKVENDSETSGSNVYHWYHNVDWTKSDDWTLEPVDNGFASLYCFTRQENDGYDLDTHQFSEDTLVPLINMGYSACLFVDEPHTTAYDFISDDSVFIYSGHGGKSCLAFKNNNDNDFNTNYDFITAASTKGLRIVDKPNNALAKLKLAIFACCETGADEEGTGSNMVALTYRKGAHFVIAHPVIVNSPYDDKWVQQFLTACAEEKTIYEAINAADEFLYEEFEDSYLYGNAIQRHMLGDYSMQLYYNEGGEE